MNWKIVETDDPSALTDSELIGVWRLVNCYMGLDDGVYRDAEKKLDESDALAVARKRFNDPSESDE